MVVLHGVEGGVHLLVEVDGEARLVDMEDLEDLEARGADLDHPLVVDMEDLVVGD